MYLKRLELHGFKSFATPTVFAFAPGVTCIAGPNGSGKTNVAEAVRWVLGEQASRIIRARKTEDIIFAGSAKRAQLGMAEVRITLDNTDGWLPLEYEEVVIARRAYRSGDNEYYVNQSRVRLKDLTELFLKAQVGQNSYAFMGQGLVEQVLTLRPDERRGLIEEAADVRLHRDKLDEARHRLDATRDNLQTVELLVTEIEPRIKQLERQADRAAAHERLGAELAQVLQALFGQQWQDAQDGLTAARAVLDQRQKEFDAVRGEFQSVEETFGALGGAIDERRRDIAQRDDAYRAIDDYRRDLEQRITVDDERRAMLTARREEVAGELDVLQREQDQLAALIGQQDERVRQLFEQLDEARRPDATTKGLIDLDARIDEGRRALADAERAAAQASARVAETEGRAAALAEQRDRLDEELRSLGQTRKEQIALLRAWGREFAARRVRVTELAPNAQRAMRALAETQSKLDQAAATIERRDHDVRTLTAEIASAEARLDAAQGADVEMPAPDAGVRAILAHGGRVPGEEPPADSRIEGLLGMVGELIRVPAGLERAIEAALADNLHAVVVKTQDDALAAVELLLSEDLGRATVIPLNDVKSSHPVNLIEERGVLGVASELVRCEARYRPLVNTLLGRTIVVQNLGVGKAVLRRGLGNVVTLDGIYLRTHGSMTAGSTKPVRIALVHQREVGELPGELEQMRAAYKEAAADLERARHDLADAERAHEQLAPDLDRLRAELTGAEDALRQHRARLGATAAHLVALHARRRDGERALAAAQQAIDTATTDVERARQDVALRTERRDALRSESEQLASSRESITRDTTERSARIAAFETQHTAVVQQRDAYAASLARLEEERGRRAALLDRLDAELKDVAARLEAARTELEQKVLEASAAREELLPARAALEQLETRQRTINSEVATARERSVAAERSLLDAEATVSLRQQELESLRERLAEEGFQPSAEGVVARAEERPPDFLAVQAGDAAASDDLPPVRGGAQVDVPELKNRAAELRAQIRRLGPINEQAGSDFAESRERYEFLSTQLTDLREAEAALLEAIDELEGIIKERFSTAFELISKEFKRYFETFFGGGNAELLLTTPDENGLPGVDIVAQPPRKRVRALNMLSGGERSLTALALLFALLQSNPSPICVLDEVDAALDEANVDRFTAALRELAERTQFVIITHNRRTLEMADTIYGVSMGDDSTSSVLSLKLSEIPAA